MANDTGKLLKEMSNLSSNMDVLFQELKESTKNNLEASKGLKDLAGSIKNSLKPGGEDLNQTFKSFTDSFTKTFSDQNSKLVSSLTDKITQSFSGSVSDFLSNVPTQIAQVKSGNVPDFKSLLGGDTIKGLLGKASQKIPGLADGGTVEKNGLAVVGERGPELVELKAGSNVSKAKDEAGPSGRQIWRNRIENALSKITTNDSLIQEFKEYAIKNLGNIDREEFLRDPDYLRDEFDYFKEKRDGETFTVEDVNKLSKPVDNTVDKNATVESQIKGDMLVSPQSVQKNPDTLAELQSSKENMNKVGSEESGNTINKIKSNEMLAGGITSLTDKLKEKLEAAKAKQNPDSAAGKIVNTVSGLAEKALTVKPNVEVLKEKALENAQELKDSTGSSATDMKTSPTVSSTKVNSKLSTDSNTSSQTTGTGFNDKDIKEMKSLLAAIYQTLKSPLTVVNDVPFRPSSNNF
jgi:hypothetical protein